MTGRSLEIGSGYHPMPEFTHHCDINPHAKDSDACVPADHLPWDDDWFDELRAVDVLEHCSWRDTESTLREWRRVLRPGGLLYVQVPDVAAAIRLYQTDCRHWDERSGLGDEPSIVGLAWVLLGGQRDETHIRGNDDWRWNAHYALFDASSLLEYLNRAGFQVESMETNAHPNLLCWARAV